MNQPGSRWGALDDLNFCLSGLQSPPIAQLESSLEIKDDFPLQH